MNPVILIFVVMIGAMLLMTRNARAKQRQGMEMRNQMEPGTGVRTIGGLYAVVKEVNDETVLLELTDGVHAHFAKNAIGAVLGEDEFNRIVHGIEPEEPEAALEADAGSDARDGVEGEAAPIDLSKPTETPEHDGSGVSAADRGGDGGTPSVAIGSTGTPSADVKADSGAKAQGSDAK